MKKKSNIVEYKNYGTWSYMVVSKGKRKYMVIYSSKGVSIVTLR